MTGGKPPGPQETFQTQKIRPFDAFSGTVMVNSLFDLKWKTFGGGFDFVAYTTEIGRNQSEFRTQCRQLSADLPAIPTTR